MKVVHVLKKIESIDEDIRELRKLEKSLAKNKSFTTPIYMSIEKQINILLGEKIKLMELKIANPPKEFAEEFEAETPVIGLQEERKQQIEKKQTGSKDRKSKQKSKADKEKVGIEETVPIVTQDFIDQKIKSIEDSLNKDKEEVEKGDAHVKLLDIALEKGSITKNDIENEKKKVRFFKDNFPGGEY